jgi:hypothetical protein
MGAQKRWASHMTMAPSGDVLQAVRGIDDLFVTGQARSACPVPLVG